MSKRDLPRASVAAVTSTGDAATGLPSSPIPVATTGSIAERYGTLPAGGCRIARPSANWVLVWYAFRLLTPVFIGSSRGQAVVATSATSASGRRRRRCALIAAPPRRSRPAARRPHLEERVGDAREPEVAEEEAPEDGERGVEHAELEGHRDERRRAVRR